MAENTNETITRYFEDAIAAERAFEDQLRAFAKTGDQEAVQQTFLVHADQTKMQHQRLEARLGELGGSPSMLKSAMAHMFAFAPAMAQLGHHPAEKNAQNLMMAYAVENAEVAMYEAFALAAQQAGDRETASLVREIQEQERKTADRVWALIPETARAGFLQAVGRESGA